MKDSKLLFIGWEGADWRLIQRYVDAGIMPNLEVLVNKGSIGKVQSIEPNMSTTLWASMFTGKRPYKHELIGVREYDDKISHVKPISREALKCNDIWDILEYCGKNVHRIGLNPSHPARSKNGTCISNRFTSNELAINENGILLWPLFKNSVFPKEKSDTFSALRVYHSEIDAEFLNEPLKFQRKEVNNVKHVYQKIVADNLSIHSAASFSLENEPWEICAIMYDGIERMSHHFLDGSIDNLEEFQQGLIRHTYQLFDLFLGQLTTYIDDQTYLVVCSEFGYGPMRIRNRPRQWDKGQLNIPKDNGFFSISGPDIKTDYLTNELSVLDLGPTILNLLDIPVGRDMDGKIINFGVHPKEPVFVDCWEREIGEYNEVQGDLSEQLERLVSLEESSSAIRDLNHRNFFFWLAKSYADDRKFESALSLTKKLHELYPSENRFIYLLSKLYDLTGEAGKSGSILSQLSETKDFSKIKGYIAQTKGLIAANKREQCTEILIKAEVLADDYPDLLAQIGFIHFRVANLNHAERVLEKSIGIHRLNYKNLLVLSRVYHANQQFEKAIDAIDEAIGVKQFQPSAHFHKGEVLRSMGNYERATRSYEIAISQNSRLQRARLALLLMYKNKKEELYTYDEHLSKFMSLIKGKRTIIASGNVKLLKDLLSGIKKTRENQIKDSVNPLFECHLIKGNNRINKALPALDKKILLTVPKFLFDLDPKYNFRIMFIEPSAKGLAENTKGLDVARAREKIDMAKNKLIQWVDNNPHIELEIIHGLDINSDNEVTVNQIIRYIQQIELV